MEMLLLIPLRHNQFDIMFTQNSDQLESQLALALLLQHGGTTQHFCRHNHALKNWLQCKDPEEKKQNILRKLT